MPVLGLLTSSGKRDGWPAGMLAMLGVFLLCCGRDDEGFVRYVRGRAREGVERDAGMKGERRDWEE